MSSLESTAAWAPGVIEQQQRYLQHAHSLACLLGRPEQAACIAKALAYEEPDTKQPDNWRP